MHSYYRALATHPPQGYEFVTSESSLEKVAKTASKIDFSYSLFLGLDKIVPLNLMKSYWGKFRKIPQNIDLTYSYDHLVFRKEPWVVDIEFVSQLVSYYQKQFKRYKGVIQKALASEYCKKIICGTEAAKRTVLLNLDCTGFEHKLDVVPFTVRKKDFTKHFTNNKVKLLFVGSANISGQFEIKGGGEILEAFILLNRKYENLELVIRSDVSDSIKRKYHDSGNIRIIDEEIPWPMLEQEFQSADIFLLPVHNTPYSVFLDAMSYELPIVTIDAWANSEIVEDGKTGLLAQKSENIPYYVENLIPSFGTPQFQNAIKTSDPKVVQELVEKTSILIENQHLRREMGKAGRWEVEHGRFSTEERNEKLKQIFDEALS